MLDLRLCNCGLDLARCCKPDCPPHQAWSDDDWGTSQGACDVCNAQNVGIRRTVAYGIETFYCEKCAA